MNFMAPHMHDETTSDSADLRTQLREELERIYGPLLGGPKLVEALGHKSTASLRQARKRGRIPVPTFRLPMRQGYFALTRDVADWLAEARLTAVPAFTPSIKVENAEAT
ncbi:MAG: pyocin activator PrtN family protein [Burkholderiaceae bacterium]|nr:pyocin activator PrtN family protein [Burkholderiaceae bacterium]